MKKKLILPAVFMLFLISAASFGATKHWNATVDRDFTNWSNWSSSTVFTSTNDGCISKEGDLAPIMYSTSTSLATNRNLYVGGIAYGELDMQGSSISLNRLEIGGDYMLSGVGADGAMTMSGGTFTTSSQVLVGSGNDGSLNMSGGTLNIGTFLTVGEIGARSGAVGTGSLVMTNSASITADHAYVAKEAGSSGSIDMSGTSSIALTTYIFVGDTDSAASVTLRDAATLTGGSLSLRAGSSINFVIDETVTASRMCFSDTEALSNSLNGIIDISFENAAVNGIYDLISFAEDMSATDISGLLSVSAAADGWSLNMATDINGSTLQAVYGIPEPATMMLLALGSLAAIRRKK